MDGRVDDERCSVYWVVSYDDVTCVVYKYEVRGTYVPEAHTERIHPEQLRVLRVPCCYMACNTFSETESAEDT